jgi:hypothetical protein
LFIILGFLYIYIFYFFLNLYVLHKRLYVTNMYKQTHLVQCIRHVTYIKYVFGFSKFRHKDGSKYTRGSCPSPTWIFFRNIYILRKKKIKNCLFASRFYFLFFCPFQTRFRIHLCIKTYMSKHMDTY